MTEGNWSTARSKSRFEERAEERRRMKRTLTVARRRSKNKGWGHPLEPFATVKAKRLGRTGGHNHGRWRRQCAECLDPIKPGEIAVRGRFGAKVHQGCKDRTNMVAA